MEVVMNDRRRDLIVAVLALAGAVFAVLQAAVVPALPNIDRALHAGPSSGTWILTVNLLATAVLTPVLGRMGDIHGKDRMLRVVLTALGLGTLACAVAPSLPVMLAGRVAQGAGGAVFPLAFGVLRDELEDERVAGAIGLVSSLLGIGAGLGLVIAGPVIAALSWHWLFWLPLAVLVPVGGAVARWVPASPVRTPAPVDLTSAALMIAGLSALLVGVALMLGAYLALTLAHRHAWQLLVATGALGLGLGFGLGALANLIVVAVGPRQTGVATAMNTVTRTLGGAFGAAIAAECLARGGSLDGDFALAFAICAGALTLGVGAVLAIPGEGLPIALHARRDREERTTCHLVPRSSMAPQDGT
jgi:MFS family permease